MNQFRSKSNFMFGVIVLAVAVIANIPAFIRILKGGVLPISIIMFILILVVALVIFFIGMQSVNISENGVRLEVFRVPLKELSWQDIKEAGIGKERINKNSVMKQLYVSSKPLKESEYENLDSMRFSQSVIWFDYSQASEEKIRFYLTQNGYQN